MKQCAICITLFANNFSLPTDYTFFNAFCTARISRPEHCVAPVTTFSDPAEICAGVPSVSVETV